MHAILKAGLAIGVLCGIWTFVMGFTGWYKDPILLNLFLLVVIPIEIGGLIWGLRRTAREGRGYGSQIVAGTMIAIVAGVVVIVSSLLFTTVAFPDYFEELQAAHREVLLQQGVPPAEAARQAAEAQAGNTPMGQALQGFLGTLVVGILASAVIAIRVKSPHPIRTPSNRQPGR